MEDDEYYKRKIVRHLLWLRILYFNDENTNSTTNE